MTNLSDIPDEDKCRAIILDSLLEDKFIIRAPEKQPSQEDNFIGNAKNFLYNHKTTLLTGTFTVAGLIAGPAIVGGVVGALGFGKIGITAGSITARIISLHRGYVTAGSLISILQSFGTAGLGIGGVIASSLGGGIFAGLIGSIIVKALLNNLKSGKELAELENFISITATNEKIIFVMKSPLLINDKILKSFYKGFDLARKITQIKKFEFSIILKDENCIKGSKNLREYLESTYGIVQVSVVKGGLLLLLNLNEKINNSENDIRILFN
ncbi:hypothetical protein C1645_764124 [Glomus cerebriforme]|uniref:Uncharacterized protein n=1 Tax=Glomus cerebriforme TaxID=658196 RepID=A0A397TD19_9GLOM|nr:hypothetical protein C1645_764124 [Glomus cerebriforme]